VLRYNAAVPTKFMPGPGYSAYVAPEKYAQIGWVLGLGGRTEEAARERLFRRVDELLAAVGMPRSLAAAGIPRETWAAALGDVTRAAFEDVSGRTNPRMPMLGEMMGLLEAGYGGG
jgi:acetaldehyde dehydrogenase/alcohol dehydrogenase